jgi:hypothetical protein
MFESDERDYENLSEIVNMAKNELEQENLNLKKLIKEGHTFENPE